MCAEFAEAELALSNVSALPTGLREIRRAEWLELIEALASEIAAALRSSDARLANMEYLRAPLGRLRR